MINGGTGPVLAFAGVLYKLSESLGVPFLTFNAWTGIWVAFYMFLAAIFDLNRIILYATRFTDEIFAFLIATIFIIDSLGSPFHEVGLYYYFRDYDLDVALLSLVICLGTTYLTFVLRSAKFTGYWWTGFLRNLVSTQASLVVSITIPQYYVPPSLDLILLFESISKGLRFCSINIHTCLHSSCSSSVPDCQTRRTGKMATT